MKRLAILAATLALLAALLPAPATADDDVDRGYGPYLPGDWRIAQPGARPVSNFYPVAGFRPVDPACWSGVLAWEVDAAIPVGNGAQFHVYERINIHPTQRRVRFPYRHRWELSSDPLEVMGVTSISQGAGAGRARAWLTMNPRLGEFRLVTDVAPRVGSYEIATSGAGISRTKTEDFYFYFGDHHYSYVNLSQLEAMAANPAVAAALTDVHALLSNRPPNVIKGVLDWFGEVEGPESGVLRADFEEPIALNWAGMVASGTRATHLRVTCPALIRQFLAR